MQVMHKASALGKCDQIDGVLRQFAQDRSCADEHIRKGNELSVAAHISECHCVRYHD
jgi:hypothetical protein